MVAKADSAIDDDRQCQMPEIVEDLCHHGSCDQLSDISPRSGNQSKKEPPANRMISRMANRNPGIA